MCLLVLFDMIDDCQFVGHVPDGLLGMVAVELLDDLRQRRRRRLVLAKGVDDEAVVDDLLAFQGKPVGSQVLLGAGDVLVGPDQILATALMRIDLDLPASFHVGDLLPAWQLGMVNGKVDDGGISQGFVVLQFRDSQWLYFRLGGRWLGLVGCGGCFGPTGRQREAGQNDY